MINVDTPAIFIRLRRNLEIQLVYLSIATTRPNASDLGFLLYKHPDRVFRSDDTRNRLVKAVGFYPEVSSDRCEFVLLVAVDPVERVRGLAWNGGIAQYVEPLPFLASSHLAQALSLCLRSAMNGIASSKDPETDAKLKALAAEKWPLEIKVTPVRSSPAMIRRMFEPLGWKVDVESTALEVDGSKYPDALHTIVLCGDQTVSDALTQLYVLLPALDPARHYFYGDNEVDKFVAKSQNWLDGHPARDLIVGRYLSKSKELQTAAKSLLDGEPNTTVIEEKSGDAEESAHDQRHRRIVDLVATIGATRIADLGCGEGRLLARLTALPGKLEIVGVEPALADLDKARKLLSRNPGRLMDPRVTLKHGSILYADKSLKGFDVAILSEVIEHIDEERLDHAERCVFGAMNPAMVIVTTPNSDFNVAFPLLEGRLRHNDHRFEWGRKDAEAWCQRVAAQYGYTFEIDGVGGFDNTIQQHLSHLIIFRKEIRK